MKDIYSLTCLICDAGQDLSNIHNEYCDTLSDSIEEKAVLNNFNFVLEKFLKNLKKELDDYYKAWYDNIIKY